MVDTIKISANPEKVSTPGLKRYFELLIWLTKNLKGIILH